MLTHSPAIAEEDARLARSDKDATIDALVNHHLFNT
jgi:hypothetical protein